MITKEILEQRKFTSRVKSIKQKAHSNSLFYLRVKKMFSRHVGDYDDKPINSLDEYNIPRQLHKWIFELDCIYLDKWSSNTDKMLTKYKYHFIPKKVPNPYYLDSMAITLKQEYR